MSKIGSVILLLLVGFVSLTHAEAIAGRTMELSVTDHAGQPMPNVAVSLTYTAGDARNKSQHVTDGEGMTEVPIPDDSFQTYTISMKMDGYVPLRATWPGWDANSTAKVPDKYIVQMEPVTTIRGTVVDDSGKPVEGATVTLQVHKKLPTPNLSLDLPQTPSRSGREGKWSFDEIPAKFDNIEIGVTHAQSANGSGFSSMNTYAKLEELRDGTAKLVLQRGVRIEGTITDSENRPLTQARVGVGSDRVSGKVAPEARVDNKGFYSVAVNASEPAVITFTARGHAPELRQVQVGQEKVTLDIQLQKGKQLRGRIVDPEGNPVTNATIYVDRWRGHRSLNPRLSTGPEGTFTWEDAPADEVEFAIIAQGFAAKRHQKITASDEEQTITIYRPLQVKGTVVDAETGKPVEKFKIVVGNVYYAELIYWQRDRGMARGQTMIEPGQFSFAMVNPSAGNALRIEADGYLPLDSRIFKVDEKEVSLEFKLVRGKDIEGIVRDATGAPVKGAKVVLAPPGPTTAIRNGQMVSQQHGPLVEADEKGVSLTRAGGRLCRRGIRGGRLCRGEPGATGQKFRSRA